MRFLICAETEKPCKFPFNYNYLLHSALYTLISKSGAVDMLLPRSEYSGYTGCSIRQVKKMFRLFTFSRLRFQPRHLTEDGFENVTGIEFVFSIPLERLFEDIIDGIFRDHRFYLKLSNRKTWFQITSVKPLKDPEFSTNQADFICLSPITVGVRYEPGNETRHQHVHCLNYMEEPERHIFIRNIYQNLVYKYERLYGKPFEGDTNFEFHFNSEYVERREGRISKLIQIKNMEMVKGFEAPFHVTADPALIEIGYHTGFGEKNYLGFGCVALI